MTTARQVVLPIPPEMEVSPAPASGPAQPRTLTAAQVRAIRTAMYTFVEEDLAFGAARPARRWCVRCNADRPAAGFISYECGDLCNACATQYELSRARGLVWSPNEFLAL
ncbi:MAG: hypothetical protein AB7R89_12150 [Dehalococcoidia bacterium]